MDAAQEAFQQGLDRQGQGDLAGAEVLHRRVLSLAPDHAGSTHCLGLIAAQRGQLAEALPLLRRAIALAPQTASY
ncbi:MAG: tetratricopeptide repeat protein, partial [Methyloceanibacter sp.]